MNRSIFFVSDSTGITAETLGHALLSQFDSIEYGQFTIPFVDNAQKAEQAVERIDAAGGQDGQRPIVFSTLTDPGALVTLERSEALVLDLFSVFLRPLELELNRGSAHATGRFHGRVDRASYQARIEAIEFALKHDDGASVRHYQGADVVLVGVSRSGKTPTCVYLSMHFGIRAANYPITDEDLESGGLPELLRAHGPRLFGLTIGPERLHRIRNERRPDSQYASVARCRREVRQVEDMFQQAGISYIDTSTISVEEIASRVMHTAGLRRRLIRGDRRARWVTVAGAGRHVPARSGEAVAGACRARLEPRPGTMMPANAERRILRALEEHVRGDVAAAYSGGADSLALLHGLAMLRDGPVRTLRAIHVDHGLHAASGAWARQCQQICTALGIALEIVRVHVDPKAPDGPEAAARAARYQVFERALGEGETLCTAHHADDQIESVLIALARGAGVRGLAGIAPRAALGSGQVARPLLAVAGKSLRAYARSTGLRWVEDPSNADISVPRNALRAQVLPVLESCWPGLAGAVGRSARFQAEAAVLLDVLARADLERLRGPATGTLALAGCVALDERRLRNALRVWLGECGLPVPSARHVEHIVRDVIHARGDARPLVRWPGAEVRRHAGAVYAMRPLAPVPVGPVSWPGAGELDLAHGRLSLEHVRGAGLRVEVVREGLVIRFRQGGERCRPQGRAHSQTLKRLLHERGVPPWERARLPLLFRRGELVAVADLWICEGFAAAAGERGLKPVWTPAAGPHARPPA